MSSLEVRLKNPVYKNWVKTGICLALVKEGLEDYAEIKSKEFHGAVLASVAKIKTYQTTICDNERITFDNNNKGKIACKHAFCETFLNAVVIHGIDPLMKFKIRKANIENCDLKLWSTDHWELAKLFMNQEQKPCQTNPSQTDLSGILNFLEHCQVPRNGIQNAKRITEILQTRNSVMNSSDMKVSPGMFQTYIQTMLDLLREPNLAKLSSAKHAESEIRKVIQADFPVLLEDEITVIKNWMTALEKVTNRTKTVIREMRKEFTSMQPKGDEEKRTLKTQIEQVEEIADHLTILIKRVSDDKTLQETMGLEVKNFHCLLEEAKIDLWNAHNELKRQVNKIEQNMIDATQERRALYDPHALLKLQTSASTHRLPAEIRMDSKSVELFQKALEDGKERDFNIRIMVVGPFGVGKTAFTKRLLCQDVDINERNSTDGIDVHVGKCKVSLKTMDWTVDPVGTTNDNALKRLAKILGSTSKSNTDETISQSLDDNQALQKNTITVSQQEEIRTSKSDKDIVEGETVEQTVKKIQNSAGDTMNSPQYQEDLLMKDLKEIVEAGDIDEDGDNATVSIWDFGGQFVFYTTHQMFLSRRAIYILVFNLNQHIDDFVTDDVLYSDCSGAQSHKIEDFIDIWLNSIHGHSTKNKEPPVLLVGTHADKLKPDQREKHVEAMFDAIRKRFAGKDASYHFIDEDFGLSNVTEDPKLSNLKQKIIEVAKIQGHWGELKPAKWIPVEKLLEGLRRSGVEILSRARLEELNSKLPVPISSDEELALFLRFQHDVANIMYYSLPELRDKIVLSPQFLVNALKSLITAESFVKKKPDVLESWLEFSERGLLKPNLLDAVWKNGKNTRSFEENRDHILALMEHLNIIARPVTFAGNDEPCDCNITKEQDYFLAPCMLKELPPLSFFQYEKSFNVTPYLCLELDNKTFPSTIFNRLLCACISRWPIAKEESNYLIYCGCGQFEVDGQHRLTLLFTSNIIGLRIIRFCSTGDPDGTVCKEVYRVVKQILRRIGDGLSLKINYKEFVKCPLGSQNSFECRHAVEKLSDNDDEFPCHGHGEKKNRLLFPSDLLKFWFDSKEFHQVQRSSDCLKTSITDDNQLRHNSVHSLQDPPAPVSIAVSAAPANSHAFKKSTDDTLDQHTLNELTKKMKSVGALVCHQQQIATVFRAGSKFVVTAAHSVAAFVGPMLQQLYDNPNFVISFQNPTEPNENPSSVHMIKSLVYYNIEYDTAVLELTDPDKLPPKLTLFHLDQPNIQVQLVHIIGYGHESNKKTLDPKCKVISPMDPLLCEAKMWLQNEKDAIAEFVQPGMQLTSEQWGYHGCDQKEKIIFNCYLQKGSSGAPILAFYNPFELFVGGMVTNGLPYCFWNLTPDGQSHFPNKYRFEMGTKMSAICAELNKHKPGLANDLFQQH